ncbi:transcription antitermination factor NusB [Spirulina sp. CS-785/01]|uniref:transcription antitermination factor NusB n=1 Tax=Spirulina sp. CS-785/01 TaxID=3021716 RepID=UPI00232E0E04|nr:transcription antitermination factor NusB [Spirulina sp. CS-785/01]MDB9313407.1 transcription antitermination factor NusB [Spirulina sp. CS-785/01]
MPSRQKPRRVARELALLGLSQISGNPEKLKEQTLHDLVLAAIRTLAAEVREALETAGTEVSRGSDRLISSEFRTSDLASSRAFLKEGLEMTQTAINRLGAAIDFPELIHLSTEPKVREYALELIGTVKRRQKEIQGMLEAALVDWQWQRVPLIDRNILAVAVAEIFFLDIPDKVAINEAVELAKRYSDDEGVRFINGVLRRVLTQNPSQPEKTEV